MKDKAEDVYRACYQQVHCSSRQKGKSKREECILQSNPPSIEKTTRSPIPIPISILTTEPLDPRLVAVSILSRDRPYAWSGWAGHFFDVVGYFVCGPRRLLELGLSTMGSSARS